MNPFRKFIQAIQRLVKFYRTGGFYSEPLLRNRVYLYLTFLFPRIGRWRIMSNMTFFNGSFGGRELCNIDRSFFVNIEQFEEACIDFRNANLESLGSQNLAELGWMQLEFLDHITSRYIQTFESKFLKTKCWNSQIPNTGKYFRLPSSEYPYWSFEYQSWQQEAFLEIVTHPQLIEILKERFGDKYYIYSIINLISFDSRESHSVQRFHRDHDDVNTLVLFIYWTSPSGGGTEFVRGSHLTSDISNLAVVDKVQGMPGSSFIMDVSGIHRGGKPVGAPRCVSWIRFSNKRINPASFYDGQINFIERFDELLKGRVT